MIIEGIVWLLGLTLNMVLFWILYQVLQGSDKQAGLVDWTEVLKYMFVLSILVFAFFIPSIMVLATRQCDTVMANSTALSGNLTTYGYTYYCYETQGFVGITFYQWFTYIWYAILFALMVFPILRLLGMLLKIIKVR